MSRVGFIGLGQMGGRMVENLLSSGCEVTAFDTFSSSLEAAVKIGAQPASSVAELGGSCSSVITMLPSPDHVAEVYMGPGGLIEAARARLEESSDTILFVDSSTIDPATAREVHAAVKAAGKDLKGAEMMMLEAPVSGGVGGAAAGTLTFMAGGESSALDLARPLLMKMGSNIIHCGGAGTGVGAKLCNNLLLAVSMAGTAEAMALGDSLGMDPNVLAQVLNTSTGRCWSSEIYNPRPGVVPTSPASDGYKGGFANSLMEKDLFLALQAGRANGVPLQFGSTAHAAYALLKAQGHGNLDFSSIFFHASGK